MDTKRVRLQAEALAPVIKEAIERAARPLEQRIKELETRQGETMCYVGIHSRMASYRRADVVTHAGSLWICTQPNVDCKPGEDAGWQLIAKGGH